MMKWRVIGLEAHDAYFNMAIDEVLLERIRKKKSPATIRFYRWSPSAVSIGRFQSMAEEVNMEKCRELGIDYVRRITGGGAVYHDIKGEITYSIVAPEREFPKGIRESYKEICKPIIEGLAALNITAEFAPINDILVNGKKISGNAQTRRNGVLLQHGTILYSLDVRRMFSVLNVSQEKISDKAVKSVEERVTSVSSYGNITMNQLYAALLESFTKDKEYEFGMWATEELEEAEKLRIGLYGTRKWNLSR
ncbi:MAG TPA: biotin/lipoate A/B protein ligase family protein [Candidatus Saccharimonadales bacterium]|nr:biotin/lipoate A/B protein ligase family protein [Candidatus Saccharimonadales bacterium]